MKTISLDRPIWYTNVVTELPDKTLFLDGSMTKNKTGMVTPHSSMPFLREDVLRLVDTNLTGKESPIYKAHNASFFVAKPEIPVSHDVFGSFIPSYLLVDHSVPFIQVHVENDPNIEGINFYYIPTKTFLSYSIFNVENVSFRTMLRLLDSISSSDANFVFEIFHNQDNESMVLDNSEIDSFSFEEDYQKSDIDRGKKSIQLVFTYLFGLEEEDFGNVNILFNSAFENTISGYRCKERYRPSFSDRYEIKITQVEYSTFNNEDQVSANYNYCLLEL